MRCQVDRRPQTTKAMTTTATAMLAAICKLRRSSYQPLCLKMPRKKSPNPRSKPRPRAVFIKDSRKNAPDNPAQTSASEPGKPWYWARRQATAAHRPNRQGTVSAATRKTSSVIAAVFGRSKIGTEEKFLVPHTGDAICTVCGAMLESWHESTHVPSYELIERPDRSLNDQRPRGRDRGGG